MRLVALLATTFLAVPVAASAANARNPYGNVDRRVDAGNDTGDSQVDRLNQLQLNGGGIPLRYAAPPPVFAAPPVAFAPPYLPYYYVPQPYYYGPRPYYYGQ